MRAIIIEAGWPIWPLLILSIIGLAIIIERSLALRSSRITPPALLDDIVRQRRAGAIDQTTLAQIENSSDLGYILAAMLAKSSEPSSVIQAHAEEAAGDVAFKLNKFLPTLAMIATVAPLMGLFGTVVGMIEIFAAFEPGNTDPGALARGISVALYNTGFGILIAIPAVIAHRAFKSHVQRLLFNMEHSARKLLSQMSKQ